MIDLEYTIIERGERYGDYRASKGVTKIAF